MAHLQQAITDFLTLKRIAVVGISRDGRQPGNLIYRKLRDAGYRVFAVNPRTDRIEGDTCYPDLASIPGGVEGAVITTAPAVTEELVHQCLDLGIHHIWLHRSFGTGSVSPAAVDFCRSQGMAVIAGGCPMMFCPPVDPVHRCMRWILDLTSRLPRDMSTP
ncbi:MAG: CoA-binding protein [Candidatus Competibacteraceae bacterium]|nr:CoA-binding protein [Candidatus Competibacteraceae bacterium]